MSQHPTGADSLRPLKTFPPGWSTGASSPSLTTRCRRETPTTMIMKTTRTTRGTTRTMRTTSPRSLENQNPTNSPASPHPPQLSPQSIAKARGNAPRRSAKEAPMSTLELSEEETQLIEILREWDGDDAYQLIIERRDGAWDLSMKELGTSRGARVGEGLRQGVPCLAFLDVSNRSGMPEQVLDDANVDALFKQVGRKTVS